MHTETFAYADIRFFRRLAEQGYAPEIIYDVGASNGRWSLEIAPIFSEAKFHLFEPLATRHPPPTMMCWRQ